MPILRKETPYRRGIISRPQIKSFRLFIVVFSAVSPWVGVVFVDVVLNSEGVIFVCLSYGAGQVCKSYYIPVPVEKSVHFPPQFAGETPYTLIEATSFLLALSNEILSPSQTRLPVV